MGILDTLGKLGGKVAEGIITSKPVTWDDDKNDNDD